MRGLLKCRRGSVAMAFLVAAIPTIGVVALGVEAGSWYVIRQHAQNAADAAAYSGALQLACRRASSVCSDAQSVDYRGKQFAAQQAFCDSADKTSYPNSQCVTFSDTTLQSVSIDIGTYTAGKWNSDPTGSYVLATVAQTQPTFLATVLDVTSVKIGTYAVALVKTLAEPCVLALTGEISFQDSAVDVEAKDCGLASNAVPTGFDFQANPTVHVGSLSTSGNCLGSTTYCGTALTYMPPVPNPYSSLDAALAATSITKSCGANLTPYTAGNQCVNKDFSANKPVALPSSGIYFFSGKVQLTGSGSICTTVSTDGKSCSASNTSGITATLILLSKASLSMAGGSVISVSAPSTTPTSAQLPSSLQSVASLLVGMAIIDTDETSPQTNGGASLTANGVIYFPKAALDFQGNPTATTCSEVIAASITFAGSPHFDTSKCPTGTPKIKSQYVALVN